MIKVLQKYNNELSQRPLEKLLLDSARFERFSCESDGLLYDYSRVHVDADARSLLMALLHEREGLQARDRLFAGEAVNLSENRPALHMLLRGGCGSETVRPDDAGRALDAMDRMLVLAEQLHQGRLPATGEEGGVTDIVHIGIGGSLLGTRLLCDALGQNGSKVPRVHFLGSVDAHAREALLPHLDPARTIVIAVSKSFSTGDTLLHARRARAWLGASLGEAEANRRMFAVTGAGEKAAEFGIPADQTLYLPDWVGGRYSLWSPVSLSAAATMGVDAFRSLLEGAAALDLHFREAAPEQNLPVLMGLIGVWHRNVCGFPAWAVFPYDQRLSLLPSHLQQLIMESNGKSVTVDGQSAPLQTAPVIFGESGTEAQHSVFQALHQGTDIVPVNFVGVIRPDHDDREAHEELLANMLAQATALACGRSRSATLEQMTAAGVANADALLPHRTFVGNRPSEILMLDELGPAQLGRLLALYEHKVFVESALWSINAFDQWGVELGKQLAPEVQAGLSGNRCEVPGLQGLLEYIRTRS